MPDESSQNEYRRGGTSQAARALAALDPRFVSIDERSLQDFLALARDLAGELLFFDDPASPVPGDWNGLLGRSPRRPAEPGAPEVPAVDLDEIAAFLRNPAAVEPRREHALRRPHLVLLLTFLELLQHAQASLNRFTARHLDYYYREVLGFAARRAVGDRVHVLVELDRRSARARLPAGTALDGRLDAAGRRRIYRTARELVATRAAVASLASVHVALRETGVREARENHPGTRDEALLRMLGIALGRPLPGSPLPVYGAAKRSVDVALLAELAGLVRFASANEGLALPLYELRSLVRLARRRETGEEWPRIRQLLTLAGRRRAGARFALPDPSSRDFGAMLNAALGGPPSFAGITLVENIDDVYTQRLRAEVQTFIRTALFFPAVAEFEELMRLKQRVDAEWGEIQRILQRAGARGRNDPSFALAEPAPRDLPALLQLTHGALAFPGGATDLFGYHALLEQIEAYFFMPAEEVAHLVALHQSDPAASAAEWERVYAQLIEAYRRRERAERRARLRQARETAPGTLAQKFDAMLHAALGENPAAAEGNPFARLQGLIQRSADVAHLLDEVLPLVGSGQAAQIDWERVEQIVERAARVREGRVDPVPVQTEWLNLHADADATQVRAPGRPGFRTFGQAPIQDGEPSPEARPPAALGWAIESPLLVLTEGTRSVKLELTCDPASFDAAALQALLNGAEAKLDPPLAVEVSGEKAWIATAPKLEVRPAQSPQSPPALTVSFALGPDADPLARPLHDPRWARARHPVLRLMLRQVYSAKERRPVARYPELSLLVLTRASLQVSAQGLRGLALASDAVELDPLKPFQPFGSAPRVGSSLYVGHRELLAKPLTHPSSQLKLELEWLGAPPDLNAHYARYPHQGPFTARLSGVERNLPGSLVDSAALFEAPNKTLTHAIAVPAARLAAVFRRPAERVDAPGDDPRSWHRYLRLELGPKDFQHASHAVVATQAGMELAAQLAVQRPADATAAATLAEKYRVQPPYTPELKQLALSYTSAVDVDLSGERASADGTRVLHVHPFGVGDAQPLDPASGARGRRLLPPYTAEGALYIGLASVDFGEDRSQRVSLLFQMAEGSGDATLAPARVRWSVSDGDAWLDLARDESSDTTRGLITSGIVELVLPAVAPGTLLPGDLVWIRASVERDSASIPDTVAIHAQAVEARLDESVSTPSPTAEALPPGTIERPLQALPGVAALRQPYASFGGRAAEPEAQLYTRISERLRHKQRAVTAWDYERLVLEQFPEIYTCRCLRGAGAEGTGRVVVVVIPDIRDRHPFDPFEPRAPADLIGRIAAFLRERSPHHAAVDVRNASYVEVKVRVGVRFRDPASQSYYRELLNDELNRYLSPWAYAEGADIAIGGRIYANSIVDFIDGRAYVDYLAHVHLFTSRDGRVFERAQPDAAGELYVETSGPDQVLVAARQHQIDLVSEDGAEEERLAGIGYMKIELDFVVG
jgi:hypothetical protein